MKVRLICLAALIFIFSLPTVSLADRTWKSRGGRSYTRCSPPIYIIDDRRPAYIYRDPYYDGWYRPGYFGGREYITGYEGTLANRDRLRNMRRRDNSYRYYSNSVIQNRRNSLHPGYGMTDGHRGFHRGNVIDIRRGRR
jgi:hypothetical protein